MKEILIKKPTYQVMVGSVPVGGGSPIVVQSMTNTDTADIEKTTEQVYELWEKGSEIVRVTVNNEASADAIPYIIENLKRDNRWFWTVVYELINIKKVLNFPINRQTVDFFLRLFILTPKEAFIEAKSLPLYDNFTFSLIF